MARPIKNNCDYFPHDAGMRNHVKVKALRQKFQNGFSIWVMLLEFITAADGNVLENSDVQYELLSGDFGVSVTEIRDVVNYCIRLEMLFEKDGFIYSESLNERLAPVYEKRGKAKELSKKQLRNNGKYVSSNTEPTVVTVTETPQSKVKERKEKENKLYSDFILKFNEIRKSRFLAIEKLKPKFLARLDEGYTSEQILAALKNAMTKQNHIDSKFEYLTPEFFTRQDKIELYKDAVVVEKPVYNYPKVNHIGVND